MKSLSISILFLLFLCLNLPLSNLKAQAQPDTTVAFAPKPHALVEVNFEMARTEKTLKKMELDLETNPRMNEIDTLFNNYRKFLRKEAQEFRAYNPYNLSKFFLENSYRSWERIDENLNSWQSEVNKEIESAEEQINEIKEITNIWQLTLESEEIKEEPQEMKDNIQSIIQKADSIKKILQKQKRRNILLEDDIAEANSFSSNITVEISQLQQHLRDSLFIAVSPPIWRVQVTKTDYNQPGKKLHKFWYENLKTVRNFSSNVSFLRFWIFSLLILILFTLLRRAYLKMKYDDSEPGHKNFTRIIIGHPVFTLATILLILFLFLYPYHPLIIGHLITLVLLINMRFILSPFISNLGKDFINRVIVLLILNEFEIVFWYFGQTARFYILFESLMGILLFVHYLKPFYWTSFRSFERFRKLFWMIALFSLAFYLFSLIANIFGYVDLSILFLRVASHVPEFTVVLVGAYKIGETLIQAMGKIVLVNQGDSVQHYKNLIEKRLLQLFTAFIVYYWFFSLGVSFEVSRVIYDGFVEFLLKERVIGTMTITIGGILSLVLIVVVTFILSGALKIIIEELILKKSRLPRGVPAAISVTIRYFLIILGFTFALSAAGIELGKFSLLAGALGVGIGFGLQNIVNNFISGIILVYERPLQVGDTIEVENLLGQVKRIGIRSSNVRTYDGAEVVVPNGNLISNQLINWTLSDNKRRIEVKVGTSYGSDPNVVLDVLKQVALDNEDTLKDPPPVALFENFGDSSLNFRLLFWVPYDIGIGTKSAVSVGIFNKFREHGIEIPFPQVDLHVKKDGDSNEKDPEA